MCVNFFFRELFAEWGMFRTKVVEKIETNIPCSVSPPPSPRLENPAVYEIIRENMLRARQAADYCMIYGAESFDFRAA
jgi:hypothetical protein